MEFALGILVLVLDIWAIMNIWGSSASGGAKILWTIGIVLLPIIGFLVWYFAGPKGRTAIA